LEAAGKPDFSHNGSSGSRFWLQHGETYGVDAAFMQLQLHGWDIHIVWSRRSGPGL
jgi:hypothetical protein